MRLVCNKNISLSNRFFFFTYKSNINLLHGMNSCLVFNYLFIYLQLSEIYAYVIYDIAFV